MDTELILLKQRVLNVEAYLRDTYGYTNPPPTDDGVPQPCSWCGSHQSVCDKSDGKFCVYCNSCEYGTDWHASPTAAWMAWNTGATLNLSEVE